jgi:phospholipid/cholesterol/gamma-HCH transport system substrate-binding protein
MRFNIKDIYTKEVRIAITTIAALCILVFGINYLKGLNLFKPSSYFYVKFSDVNGLAKSSPVFADGFKVGIVRDILYDYIHPGNVAVEVELNTAMRIPKGSRAQIASDLMGGLRLNLLLTNNSRESYQVGDTLSGELNAGLMASVSQLVPQIERMLPKLDSILTSLNAIAGDPSIRASLHSLQRTTANLDVASSALKRVMKSDVPQIAHKLNSIGDNFVAVSNNLKGIDFQASMNKVDSTLNNVKAITDKLNNKDNSMGLLMNDTHLYNNLNSTFMNASSLMEDLKANPKRYVHFSIFGKKNK